MELSMGWLHRRYASEFGRAPDPYLRQYKIDECHSFEKTLDDHVSACWSGCSSQTLNDFSALGYFLGRQLRRRLNVPVGLINVAVDGSTIEGWMDASTLATFPGILSQLDGYATDAAARQRSQESLEAIARWYGRLDWEATDRSVLSGVAGPVPWKALEIPCRLEEAAEELVEFNGLVYLRRTVEVSSLQAFLPAILDLGTLVDADTVYVNGHRVGHSDYQYERREYPVPEGVLHAGANEILISLVCERGGGRVTAGKRHELIMGKESIDLDGEWEYCVASRLTCPCPAEDFIRWKPTVLYKGMLAACQTMTVRAAVWYQGESNAGHPDDYEALLTALIGQWRAQWHQNNLPFYIVQLPNFSIDLVEDGGWSTIREAQRHVANTLPQVETIVSLDAGEWNDLHPENKEIIAVRTASAMLAQLYGYGSWNPAKFVHAALPIPSVSLTNGDAGVRHIELTFDDGKGGDTELTTLDGCPTREFSIAWSDGCSLPVPARIEGNKVIIDLPDGRPPHYVRYAWRNAPSRGLLCSKDGLPVSPFIWKVR
jgi:sialate O-acetylesterase